MAVSEHNCRHLHFAYPYLPVCHVWEHIDPDVFHFRPLKQKKRQISYLPKSKLMLRTIHHTFQARARAGLTSGAGIPWIAIENRSEREAASLLEDSMAFVFTSIEEGLSRTCIEALLSGCVVLAYGHGPIPEYLPQNLCFKYGEAIEIVQAIERLMDSDFLSFESDVCQGRQNALRYGPEQQRSSVCAAWEEIFSRARG
jgi:glycosyltransferase involved in cell wall biosynthesis